MKKYILLGDPIPLARPRFSNYRYTSHIYDSQKDIKRISVINLINQHTPLPPFSGPLLLNVTFYFQIPINTKLIIEPGDPHFYKPDLSNIIKYIEDISQNAGLIKDDCTIVKIVSQKCYDHTPRTEFYFEEIPFEKKVKSNGRKKRK